jgi:hypothetical protein
MAPRFLKNLCTANSIVGGGKDKHDIIYVSVKHKSYANNTKESGSCISGNNECGRKTDQCGLVRG